MATITCGENHDSRFLRWIRKVGYLTLRAEGVIFPGKTMMARWMDLSSRMTRSLGWMSMEIEGRREKELTCALFLHLRFFRL